MRPMTVYDKWVGWLDEWSRARLLALTLRPLPRMDVSPIAAVYKGTVLDDQTAYGRKLLEITP
jgi:hypothetical protein